MRFLNGMAGSRKDEKMGSQFKAMLVFFLQSQSDNSLLIICTKTH
jgi:hypothetical protein